MVLINALKVSYILFPADRADYVDDTADSNVLNLRDTDRDSFSDLSTDRKNKNRIAPAFAPT